LLIGVVGAEAIDTNPRVEKALRKAYDGFAAVAEGLLEQAKKEGLVERSLDAACTAQMFIGMYMGGILHQRLYRKEFPLNRSLPVLQEMLLRSVVGALPARHLRKSPPTPKPR
jgi:hypothetical protein